MEVEEGFGKGQKGSSAMPHKKNPILSENLTGLARVVRSLTIPALEMLYKYINSLSKPEEKMSNQKKIDGILDKISKSGYESLSKEEKDFLFKNSDKN